MTSTELYRYCEWSETHLVHFECVMWLCNVRTAQAARVSAVNSSRKCLWGCAGEKPLIFLWYIRTRVQARRGRVRRFSRSHYVMQYICACRAIVDAYVYTITIMRHLSVPLRYDALRTFRCLIIVVVYIRWYILIYILMNNKVILLYIDKYIR